MINSRTLPHVNEGFPFDVVKDDSGNIGVRDSTNGSVWWGYDLSATDKETRPVSEVITLPSFPANYGSWKEVPIGGISKTVRRIGIYRAEPKTSASDDSVTLLATNARTPHVVKEALDGIDCAHVIDMEYDDSFGNITEVRVLGADNVAFVSARIARTDARVYMEDEKRDLRQYLGIERLDREPDPRRGSDKWRFTWLPSHWKRVPLSWNLLAENVPDTEDIEKIPFPLRQHVAKKRIDEIYASGTHWKETTYIPSQYEIEKNETCTNLPFGCNNV